MNTNQTILRRLDRILAIYEHGSMIDHRRLEECLHFFTFSNKRIHDALRD